MYITQALHRALQQRPDQVASRFGHRSRTFRELGDRVARLAGALHALGMNEGDRIAMLVDKHIVAGSLETLLAHPHPQIQQYFSGGRAQALTGNRHGA